MDQDFQLGSWVVQPTLNSISLDGQSTHLEPKTMAVLVCLALGGGGVVAKEKLLNEVWPNTFVGDDVLTRCISDLRRALGDDPKAPRIIQTIPKRGYRLLEKVELIEPLSPPPTAPTSSHSVQPVSRPLKLGWGRRHSRYLAPMILLTVIVGWSIPRYGCSRERSDNDEPIRSLAVLPLVNLSGDSSQEYLVDGITDGLITNVAEQTTTRVISRTSAMHFKGTRQTLPEIARALNVDAVVEGTVARSANDLRINVQLIRASDDSHLWGHSYEGELGDTFVLQSRVADDITSKLQSKQLVKQRTKLAPPSAESHDFYLHGIYYLNKFTKDGLDQAIFYFNRSLQADHQNALAYAGLAESYLWMSDLSFLPSNKAYPQVKVAVLQALHIDPELADAHTILAWVAWAYDWDRVTAEKEFLRSIDLNPNSAKTHAWYAVYLSQRGRIDEAIKQINRAEQLDPLSLSALVEEYVPYYFSREYDKAIDASQRALAMDESSALARAHLVEVYELTGRLEKAIEERERGAIIRGEKVTDASRMAASYRRALSKEGVQGYWRMRFNSAMREPSRDPLGPVDMAILCLHLHRKDQAFRWLEEAYDEKTVFGFIDNDPNLETLKSDVRFQSLMRRISPIVQP